jgi:cytochrome c
MTSNSAFYSSILSSRVSHWLLLGCFAFFTNIAHADTDQLKKLMQANNCMACHQIDKRKYGPQFDEIPAKYKGDDGAIAKLAAKIKAGGSGVWGEDMMPPQPQVSDADAKSMATLIMALKPGS